MLHIYETYCLDESVDKISFDRFIVEEIRNSKSFRLLRLLFLLFLPPAVKPVFISDGRKLQSLIFGPVVRLCIATS